MSTFEIVISLKQSDVNHDRGMQQIYSVDLKLCHFKNGTPKSKPRFSDLVLFVLTFDGERVGVVIKQKVTNIIQIEMIYVIRFNHPTYGPPCTVKDPFSLKTHSPVVD